MWLELKNFKKSFLVMPHFSALEATCHIEATSMQNSYPSKRSVMNFINHYGFWYLYDGYLLKCSERCNEEIFK